MSAQTNQQLIETFYSAFQNGDAETMARCYTDDVVFHDPAFGELHGEEARNMWRMLLRRSNGINIVLSNVRAAETTGSAHWDATYVFAQTNRNVINRIDAAFRFRDGKISHHTDVFSMWKWSRQALGLKGWLLGWSPLVKNAVRKQTRSLLDKYTSNLHK